MGCGKSSVGRRLSELLCCPFMDLDDVIVERERRSIPDIFATDGEAAFRAIEAQTLKKIVCHPERSNCHPERSEGSSTLVLALGGGTVMTPECAELVRENTVCIYLRASVDTLMQHLASESAGRPLLQADNADCHFERASDCHFERPEGVEKSTELRRRIETLMQQRSSTYEKTAHITIDTDGKSVEAIASEIASVLNRLTSL